MFENEYEILSLRAVHRTRRLWRDQLHYAGPVLNHRSGVIRGVAAVYNRCRYEPEKREALSAWAAHVANLIPAPAIGLPLAAQSAWAGIGTGSFP